MAMRGMIFTAPASSPPCPVAALPVRQPGDTHDTGNLVPDVISTAAMAQSAMAAPRLAMSS